jgi:arsenite methyltransferase
MGTLEFEGEAAARLERMYVTPEAVEQRAVVRSLLEPGEGERILDVGVGPGFLAAEVMGDVGQTGSVVGIDVSSEMLKLAESRGAGVDLVAADCTSLPFAADSFDGAVAVQVYEYVTDVPAALRELARVLRPGGRAVVVDTDGSSLRWRGGDESQAERILEVWEGHVPHPHLPQQLPSLCEDAGLALQARRRFPIVNTTWKEGTFGVALLELVLGYATEHGIDAAEASAWRAELRSSSNYSFSIERSVFLVQNEVSTPATARA